ncbi:hypothetical protein NWT83_06025 [Klebsiella quasipneumoniae]|uniref:tail fiber/spike domain-containing protein n=1 Tax=Klebsiella quasipneumoniae TaxID=1463165 RepID=UPI0011297641|nr:hypothetical protein [Klebsiella quasipneumoniae]QER53228.1 hypothetical protein F2980_08795 [Klebsiella quasipneumoniae subsp. quasipneumoniae]TPB66668.1 hypothetical protein EC587_16320 [Klebsiella quasipneumoniae subsp. quasipneumoniae]UVG27090.1 hypothetical protein NWT83_06025 [Klebsiella quasipneumoniae]UVG32106.1 hypothetical protein NWT71_06025 [Klebsiella quasipneumoniae]
MARIPESSSWEEDIELISRSERVSGGLDGVANRPLKSLANRTRYLKELAEASGELVAEKVSAVKTFTEGATLGSPREEILHGSYRLVWTGEFPKVVPVASSPETTGGVGPGRWAYTSDAAIRQNLASGNDGMGDALMTVKQPFSGATSRSQHDKNAEFVSVMDFSDNGVSGRDYDNTAAFEKAYATGLAVYVPPGEYLTHTYNRHLTFGPGVIYSDDDMFSDAGHRPTPPFPNNGGQYTTYHNTRGNAERAAGRAMIINNPDGRVQISKFSDPSQYSTYVNRDHVGAFLAMYAPRNFVSTTAASSTYTAFTLTAPEIFAGANVQVGDFINTTHSPVYKGKILDIDFSANTVTVDGWYVVGNAEPGQVPANGYAATINKADKIWGRNDLIYLDQYGLTATGYEMGFMPTITPGNPVWGMHVVNHSTDYTLDHGYRVTGQWRTGYYAGSRVIRAFRHEVGASDYTTVRTEDNSSPYWTGSLAELQTDYRKATSYLAKITTGAVTWFSIDSRGQRSAQIEAYGVVSSDTTISGLSPSIISCTNATTTPITLSLTTNSMRPGQAFEVRARGGLVSLTGIVGGTLTLNTAEKPYCRFHYDGVNFLLLTHSS